MTLFKTHINHIHCIAILDINFWYFISASIWSQQLSFFLLTDFFLENMGPVSSHIEHSIQVHELRGPAGARTRFALGYQLTPQIYITFVHHAMPERPYEAVGCAPSPQRGLLVMMPRFSPGCFWITQEREASPGSPLYIRICINHGRKRF